MCLFVCILLVVLRLRAVSFFGYVAVGVLVVIRLRFWAVLGRFVRFYVEFEVASFRLGFMTYLGILRCVTYNPKYVVRKNGLRVVKYSWELNGGTGLGG